MRRVGWGTPEVTETTSAKRERILLIACETVAKGIPRSSATVRRPR